MLGGGIFGGMSGENVSQLGVYIAGFSESKVLFVTSTVEESHN